MTSTPQDGANDRPVAARRWWTLAISSVAIFMVALDNLVVATALPSIRRDLGATISELEWTVNAYVFSFAVLLLTGAALGDRFGRRRMFSLGLAVFSLASALAAVAPDATTLVAARAVQGAGAALVMPLSLTLLADAFPPERRGLAFGIWGGVGGAAVAMGPIVAGTIIDRLSWPWIFWLNVPIGLAAVPLARLRLRESFGHDRSLDLPGIGLAGSGLLGVVWALVRGNAVGWASAGVIVPAAAGFVLLAAFVLWEQRAAAPMMPMRFFRSRAFAAASGVTVALSFSLFGSLFLVAQYLQTALGYSPLQAGLRTLPWTAAPMLVSPVAGALSSRIGSRPLMVGGLLLQAAALAWLGHAVASHVAYGGLVGPLIASGVGISLIFPAIPETVFAAVPASDEGKASGVNGAVRELGGLLGVAVLTLAFSHAGGLETPAAFARGLHSALLVGATAAALGAAVALLVPAPRHRLRAPDTAAEPAT